MSPEHEPEFEVKLTGRTDRTMVDVAEALSVSTETILAVHPAGEGGGLLVVYSPNWPPDMTLWVAHLAPDADGILRLTRVPVAQPGMAEDMEAKLREHMQGLHLSDEPEGGGQ